MQIFNQLLLIVKGRLTQRESKDNYLNNYLQYKYLQLSKIYLILDAIAQVTHADILL